MADLAILVPHSRNTVAMQHICPNCITDPYLRKNLMIVDHPCDVCLGKSPTINIFDLAIACDKVLDAHFEVSHLDDAVRIYERNPSGTNVQDTLRLLKIVPEEAIEHLNNALETLWFDRDTMESKYAADDDDGADPWFRLRKNRDAPVSTVWANMESSLQHEARYLNPEAIRVLEMVLGDIHSDRMVLDEAVVVDAGPNTNLSRLYRARVFQTEAPLIKALGHPARLLGTPAPGAGPAGRMNSKGQPAFYGATSIEVAIAEVRPPVGSRVVTAAFDLQRPIKLLDLEKLGRVQLDRELSLFDPRSIAMAQRRDFLRTLTSRLVQPVMPELQDRDYLVTQVIADYLSTHPKGAIDGIIYASVQKQMSTVGGGNNVALFPRASWVKGADGRALGEATLWEYEPDGPGRYLNPEIREVSYVTLDNVRSRNKPGNPWPVTLSVATNEFQVHDITGIEISSKSSGVSFIGLRK